MTKIEHTFEPETSYINFLTQKINETTPDIDPVYPFAFFIRDDNGEIIAGCNGAVIFGSMYTDQLWVHSDYRKKGYGRKLMEHIHNYGRSRKCTVATVATMSFQGAIGFYERLGYKVDFERKGYINGASAVFLSRSL